MREDVGQGVGCDGEVLEVKKAGFFKGGEYGARGGGFGGGGRREQRLEVDELGCEVVLASALYSGGMQIS